MLGEGHATFHSGDHIYAGNPCCLLCHIFILLLGFGDTRASLDTSFSAGSSSSTSLSNLITSINSINMPLWLTLDYLMLSL